MNDNNDLFDLSNTKIDHRDQVIADFYHKAFSGNGIGFEILYKDKLLASIKFDSERNVTIKQFTDHVFYRQFKKPNPNSTDLYHWLHRRCFPKERYNRKQLMHDLRLGRYQHAIGEYMLILKQTHGILLEDYIWIRFAGEDLTYEDVKVRD